MRAKYHEIVRVIEQRLLAGDYAVGGVPSERKIADEFSVGHMTARRAVQQLIRGGRLRRPAAARRVARSPRIQKNKLRVCVVLPAFESAQLTSWHAALAGLVASRDGLLRTVAYTHAADPAIHRELQGDFSAMFVVPPPQPSSLLLDALVRRRERVVTLWYDATHLGLLHLDVTPADAPAQVVEYLASLGHRRIDCLNTEPLSTQMELRMDAWRAALTQHGLEGELHNHSVQPFEQAGLAALETTRRLLRERRLRSTALFCTSAVAAVAVTRACHEAGVRVGRDLSIATIGGMSVVTLNTPTITTVKPADFVAYLERGLEYMLHGIPAERKSLHLVPDKVDLWLGESTGPVSR